MTMKKQDNQPTDMRKHRRNQERALVIAVVLLLIIGGSVTIGLVYGWTSVFTGALCLIPGAAIFAVLWLLLVGLERFVKRDD